MSVKNILLMLVLSGSLMAKTIYAEYLAHTDGDTLLFKSSNKEFICDLHGIDAPELHTNKKLIKDSKKTFVGYDKMQNAGMESYMYLKDSLSKKIDYRVEITGKNCIVYAPRHKSSINEKIVFDGYAVVDKKTRISPSLRYKLFTAQAVAKNDRMGLWDYKYNIMNGLSLK